MREMKDSGIQWIGNIPIDWSIKRVKDSYSFVTGFTPSTDNQSNYNDPEGYEWATIADVNEGKVTYPTKSLISREFVKSTHKKKCPKGSLLFSFKLSVGQTAFLDREIFTNEALACFIPNRKENLKFLKYSSSLIENNSNFNIYGAKILNQQLINNAYIVYPTLEEQKCIAEFLDKKCAEIDGITKDLQEQIETLENYKKSVITEAVTKGLNPNVEIRDSGIGWIHNIPKNWTVIKGKYLFNIKKQVVGAKVDDYERLALTLNGVIKRSKDDNEGLQPDKFNTYQILRKNELVFKLIDLQNVSTSRVGLSSYTGIVSPAYIILKATKQINPAYAEKYYLMMWVNQVFNILGDSGVRSSLNSKELLELCLPLPSYGEQKEIADYLDTKCAEIDEIIKNKKEQLETIEEYKKSLIYEYVTGKKEVKNA